MDKISDIARSADLKIIEDCAQSHGASYKGRKAGTFGDLSAFSFYPTKNLGALGDGGSINTDSADLGKLVRMVRNYGSEKKYHNDVIGVNSRLDELQAALLNVKLPHLDEINNHKRELAAVYHANLNDNFILPEVDPDYHDVYHIFNVRHPRRDSLKQYLEENGIKTDIHYPVPPHRQVALKALFLNEKFPVSEEIHRTTLSLPISFCHSKKDILRVIDVMNNFKS
jgi:dTDP-4-amino-4,6-dideoxygalactose transaminase